MDTPFGLRRHLLLTFPEVRAASVSIPARQWLSVRYVPSDDGKPDHDALSEWVKQNTTAGIGFTVERVAAVNVSDLPAAQLAGTSLPLDLAEDTAINVEGLIDFLRRRWPDNFVRLHDGPGHVTCVVAANTALETQEMIKREVSLVLHRVDVTTEVDTSNAARSHVASRAELALAEDWDRMYAACDDAITGRYQPRTLDEGVYAALPMRPTSLYCHLSVATRVYVEVPRTIEEMQRRHGVSWMDFLDAMSTGRVVPVFRLSSRMYERGMLDAALDAGGDRILPGENRLRELRAFADEMPAVRLAAQLDDRWRELHAAVRRHPDGARLIPFFDAIAQAGARTRMVARRAGNMVAVWAPIAFAIDNALQVVGPGRRDLEFASAIDVMTAAQGCSTRPIVATGDLIGAYVQFLYAPPSESKVPSYNVVREPPVVAKLVLERAGGISLRQFAESFDGPAIRAMQRLIQSPRLTGQDLDATVADFEREMHAFNGRRRKLGQVSGVVDGAVALASLSAGWGLIAVALTIVAKHLIAKSVLTDEQIAKLVGSTREAAYLARIDAAISNR